MGWIMKQVSSFTSNFKKYAGRVLGAVLLLLLFAGVEKCLEFLLINDTNEWSRAMLHDFYTRTENIDSLYLGSSHVYCGLNPEILEKEAGGSHFNMATPAQPLNGTYYLLKEADKYNELSHVYVELYFGQSTGEEGRFKEENQLPRNWRNTNYMKPSLNKLAYMLDMSEKELAYLTFLPARRYAGDIFLPDKIKETVRQKRTEAYRDYAVENVLNGVTETYAENGFYYSEHKAAGGVLYDIVKPEPFAQNPMTGEAEKYLRKVIEYCQREGIALTLYSLPITDYQAVLYGEYDRYIEQIKELAAEYGLYYYDFNLCRENVLDLTEDELFRDKGHLNLYGAEIFSAYFADLFYENGSFDENRAREKFQADTYSSYREKLQYGKQRIMGILATGETASDREHTSDTDRVGVTISSVDNLAERGVEFHVYTTAEDGSTEELRSFEDGAEKEIRTTVSKSAVCLFIEARPEGAESITNSVQMEVSVLY